MAYDKNVKSENVTVDTKRKISRVVFYRNENGVSSEALVDEVRLVGNEVIGTDTFLVKTDKFQFDGIAGFTNFIGGYINMVSDLKDEFDASGSLATGSLQLI